MNRRHLAFAAVIALPMAATIARADDPPAAAPAAGAPAAAAAPAADAAPAKWSDTLKIGAQLEGGIAGNVSGPSNNINYGQLYTDQANSVQLNQALLSIGRPLDPKATDYDFGFKIQGLFGTDARFMHFGRLWDKVTRAPYQYAINEADMYLHTPWLTDGGIDFTLGLFPTPLGFETIDASTNPFYSHSYIFDYGLPVNHSGLLAVTHATSNLDIYSALTAGNQTIAGSDNNSNASFLAGFKYTMLDGNISILALTHIGPEDASRAIKPYNTASFDRYYNDVVITWKASDALTFNTEVNYVQEDFGIQQGAAIKNAAAGGLAQYVAYTLNDNWTLNGRAEVFVDTRSYFVGNYASSQGPIRAVEGYSYPFIGFSGRNSYSEFTIGTTWKPTLPDWANGVTLLVRPEARLDAKLNGNARYNNGKDATAEMLSMDFVLTY